jgi:hypothetical protein
MEKKSFYYPSSFRGGFIFPFLYKARTGLAGTLPCLARPCSPPSQPVSPSPVPTRARHRHSQSAPFSCPARPCWPPSQPVIHYVRAQHGLETRAPSGTDGRMDVLNLYIRFFSGAGPSGSLLPGPARVALVLHYFLGWLTPPL